MRKNNNTQEFRESTIKFCIDNSDKSISSIEKDLGLNKGTLEEENKRLRKAYFAKETL